MPPDLAWSGVGIAEEEPDGGQERFLPSRKDAQRGK